MSIRLKIFLIFIIISVAILITSSVVYFFSFRNSMLQEIKNHLLSISNAKNTSIAGIIDKRKEQFFMLSGKALMGNLIERYLDNGDVATRQQILNIFNDIRVDVESVRNMHFLDTTGKVMVSTDLLSLDTNFRDQEFFEHALNGEICTHQFFYDTDLTFIVFVSGLLTKEDRILGVFVIEMLGEDIVALVDNYEGLGETGETIIARKDRDSGKTFFVTPMRFQRERGVKVMLEPEEKYAMNYALNKDSGIRDDLLDYKNDKVIAVLGYISGQDWGVVTKMDMYEVMIPIRKAEKLMIWVFLLILSVVVFVAYIFSSYIINPLNYIGKIAYRITKGELELRVDYTKKNEFGVLSKNFNEMTEKLLESRKRLEKSNESLNQFAYIVSHDLKSPLQTIEGLSAMLKDELSGADKDIIEMLGMMEYKVKAMQGMIDGILQYSRLSTEHKEKKFVNVDAILKQAISNVFLPPHIKVRIETDMPEIRAEKVMLAQVFQNLISNSVKYMDKPEGHVRIGVEEAKDYYQFYVADNGSGIEPAYHHKIFELFGKAHQDHREDSTGIGLAVVKKIIEFHEGRIWVDSKPGEGSTFYFTIKK